MDSWFTVEQIDCNTFAISEYKHWEETHSYLLCGEKMAVLIDTGLGISNGALLNKIQRMRCGALNVCEKLFTKDSRRILCKKLKLLFVSRRATALPKSRRFLSGLK